jgi:hypothetical protein
MNRKISIAVGTAAAVAFAGAAMASDLVTINSSEGYTSIGSEAFIPGFLRNDCGHQDGTDTYAFVSGSCPEHGETMVSLAANGGFWDGGDAVPVHANDESSGYAMLQPNGPGGGGGDAFDNGLFRTDGTSYFSGLTLGWNTIGDALNLGPDLPMGAPTGVGSSGREFWVDQTVIGYVETLRDTNGNQGDGGEAETTLAMNFRTSLTFTGSTDLGGEGGVSNHIDQRLEQMVELVDGSNNPNAGVLDISGTPGNDFEFEASRQTLQQAFALDAGSGVGSANDTTDPDANNTLHEESMGQLVSQDVEGFFFSCINCDTQALTDANAEHAFTPEAIDAHYMPYVSGWQTVPTVTHAP